jgi:hypothetical protein
MMEGRDGTKNQDYFETTLLTLDSSAMFKTF